MKRGQKTTVQVDAPIVTMTKTEKTPERKQKNKPLVFDEKPVKQEKAA